MMRGKNKRLKSGNKIITSLLVLFFSSCFVHCYFAHTLVRSFKHAHTRTLARLLNHLCTKQQWAKHEEKNKTSTLIFFCSQWKDITFFLSTFFSFIFRTFFVHCILTQIIYWFDFHSYGLIWFLNKYAYIVYMVVNILWYTSNYFWFFFASLTILGYHQTNLFTWKICDIEFLILWKI